MLQILLLTMTLNAQSTVKTPDTKNLTAQVTTCQWPNKCAIEAAVAQVQPCVWPNKCAEQTVAQVQTCQWPNRCKAEKQVHTCDYPNKCS